MRWRRPCPCRTSFGNVWASLRQGPEPEKPRIVDGLRRAESFSRGLECFDSAIGSGLDRLQGEFGPAVGAASGGAPPPAERYRSGGRFTAARGMREGTIAGAGESQRTGSQALFAGKPVRERSYFKQGHEDAKRRREGNWGRVLFSQSSSSPEGRRGKFLRVHSDIRQGESPIEGPPRKRGLLELVRPHEARRNFQGSGSHLGSHRLSAHMDQRSLPRSHYGTVEEGG